MIEEQNEEEKNSGNVHQISFQRIQEGDFRSQTIQNYKNKTTENQDNQNPFSEERIGSLRKLNSNSLIYLNHLGKGGFGFVDACYNKNLSLDIAKKKIPLSNNNSFLKEYEIVKKVEEIRKKDEHNNSKYLTKFLESYKDQLYGYLIFEPGSHTLEDYFTTLLLDPDPEFDDLNRKNNMKHLIEGFSLLESEGIAHRDIKPSNILMVEYEENNIYSASYKIADFGNAIFVDPSNSSKLINKSTISGFSKPYLAPELMQYCTHTVKIDGPYNPFLSDVYSLGLVFLQMINSKWGKKEAKKSFLRDIPGLKDPIIQKILQNMLRKDPLKRWTFNQIEVCLSGSHCSNLKEQIKPNETEISEVDLILKKIKDFNEIGLAKIKKKISEAEKILWDAKILINTFPFSDLANEKEKEKENGLIIEKLVSELETNCYNFGRLHERKSEYLKAKEWISNALEINQIIFAENTAKGIKYFYYLGKIHFRMGKVVQAKQYFYKAFEISLLIGENWTMMFYKIKKNLGKIYQIMEKFRKALQFSISALEDNLKIDNYREIAKIKLNLAELFYFYGISQQEFTLILQILNFDSLTQSSFNKDNLNFSAQQSLNLAKENYLCYLDYLNNLEENKKPSFLLVSTYNVLGFLEILNGNLAGAEKMVLQAFKVFDRKDHFTLAFSNHILALINLKQNNPQEAEKLCVEALKIMLKYFEESHFFVSICYRELGFVKMFLDQDKNAFEKYFMKALNIMINILGENNTNIVEIYMTLGNFFMKTNNLGKGEQFYLKALNIRLNQYGTNHRFIAFNYAVLNKFYEKNGNMRKGKIYYEKSLKMLQMLYGKNFLPLAKLI